MKKLISLILALVLLVSAIPAFAASSLKPEDVIGTWHHYKTIAFQPGQAKGVVTNYTAKDKTDTVQFYADETGKITGLNRYTVTWSIKGNTVTVIQASQNRVLLSLKYGKGEMVFTVNFSDGETIKLYYKKIADTPKGKTVKKAILSSGTYTLNNSGKTAVFTAPADKKAALVTVPDTIQVNGKTYKVTEIGAKACAGMKKLSALAIGKNVKTIGANAFSNCAKLKKITVTGTSLSKIGANAFSNTKSKAAVFCAEKKIAKYQKLFLKAGIAKNAEFKAR